MGKYSVWVISRCEIDLSSPDTEENEDEIMLNQKKKLTESLFEDDLYYYMQFDARWSWGSSAPVKRW